MNYSPWDCHLPNDIQRQLQLVKNIKPLSLSEVKTIIEKLNVKKAVLGGGEPSIDRELPHLIRMFNDLGVKTILLTNGYILDEEFIRRLEDAGLDETCVSIKAYADRLHIFYTGKSNKQVLSNFSLLNNKSRITLRAESILIPKLIDQYEIEKIARFIASVNKSVPYRIDGYMPIPNTQWSRPSPQEVLVAVQMAKKHLENVSCIHSEMEVKGDAINIYPYIKTG